MLLSTSYSCNTVKNLVGEPSALETITALRNLLDNSTLRAVSKLRKMQNGGLESILPQELGTVLNGLRSFGLTKEIDQVSEQIGKASQIALEESGHIIKGSIAQLSFSDASKVVLGGENAATSVLKQAVYKSVKNRYSEKIKSELESTDAIRYWSMAAGAFNLLSNEKIDKNLPNFLAKSAVDGLFLSIGHQEKDIRLNYRDLGDKIVTKVFDYYKTKN